MYEEVEQMIAAVRREVARADGAGPAARILTARRAYDAAPDAAWDALTRPDSISRWLAPVSGDLRPGGRFRLEGNASGQVGACERGRRIAASWETPAETGRVSVELASAPGGVEIVLRHVAQAPAERWRKFGPGVIGVGWDLALLGLGRHLGSPGAADFAGTTREWSFTDEGRTFVRQSASEWGKAAAADGEDLLESLEAAARAAQVYAGEGSDAG